MRPPSRGAPIPAAQNASTVYPIAVVSRSRHQAIALAFENYVLSAAGRKVLAAAGFQTP